MSFLEGADLGRLDALQLVSEGVELRAAGHVVGQVVHPKLIQRGTTGPAPR